MFQDITIMSEAARNMCAVCRNGSPEHRNHILRTLCESSEPGADKLLDSLLKSGTSISGRS